MKGTLFGAIQPLREGARVALVAPSGFITRAEDLERALDNVRSFGWTPVPGAHISAQLGYLAGSDADRLADINAAFASDEIDAVWCVRGGYGAMRLLADIDYTALRRHRKPVIGFSDVTALHSHMLRESPRLFFMHFWGVGTSEKIAEGIKAALAKVATK